MPKGQSNSVSDKKTRVLVERPSLAYSANSQPSKKNMNK